MSAGPSTLRVYSLIIWLTVQREQQRITENGIQQKTIHHYSSKTEKDETDETNALKARGIGDEEEKGTEMGVF